MATEKLKRVKVSGAGFGRIRIEIFGESGAPISFEADLPLQIDFSSPSPVHKPAPAPAQTASVPGNGSPATRSATTPDPQPARVSPPPPSPGLKLRFTEEILGEDLLAKLRTIRVLDPHGRETDLGLILRRELSQLFGMRTEIPQIRARTGSTLKNFTDEEVLRYFESLRKLATA